MRKLHWVSLALIAAPVVLMHACGGDDTAPGGTAGSGGSGTAGSAGSGTAGKAGTAGTSGTAGTAGSGAGGSSAGAAGSKADSGPDGTGTGGSTTEGGAGSGGSASTEGGDALKLDVAVPDVAVPDVVIGDAPANNVCNNDASSAKAKSCADYCDTFFATCNDDAVFADAGGKPYANNGACRSSCSGFTQDQLCCYLEHVNNAANADGGLRSTHCTHAAGAAGNGVCPVRQ